METTVNISLKDFDELRKKASNYDELKSKYDKTLKEFPRILCNRMANVLDQMVLINSNTQNLSYSDPKRPKSNGITVNVKHDEPVIDGLNIEINPLNEEGYYTAIINCNYK